MYIKESLDGAVTAVMTAHAAPDNPPYEYDEITRDEYDTLIRAFAVRAASEPETPEDGLTVQDLLDALTGVK